VKRLFFITSLLSLACLNAPAEGTSRGYTSTQSLGGVPTSSLDKLIFSFSQPQKSKTPVDDDSLPFTPKAKAFVVAPRTVKKTVKDDRQVIVTKEAFDTEKLSVKMPQTEKVAAASKIVKAPISTVQTSNRTVSPAEFSPIPRATQ
jgi:hypothetical protein